MKIAANTYYIALGNNKDTISRAIANAMATELACYNIGVDPFLMDRISRLNKVDAKAFCVGILKDYTVGKLNPPLFKDWEQRTFFSFGECMVQILGYMFQLSGNDLHSENYVADILSKVKYSKEIVDEYLALCFRSCWMRPLNIAGVAAEMWKKVGYSAEEFFDFWKEYIEYVFKINRRGLNFTDQTCVDFLKRIVTLKPGMNACLGAPCGACTIQAAYDQWGDVYTCDEARACEVFKLGNVKTGNYKKIFSSGHALNFVGLTSAVSSLCDSCEWHPYCSPCLVSSFGAQKNLITKPNDFLCKIRGKQVEFIFKQLVLSENREMLLKWMK